MKGIHMFTPLVEKTDEELQEIRDSLKAGKPPVYAKPIRELLAFVGDGIGETSADWKELHPDGKDRGQVVTGFRNHLKKHPEGYRITVAANPVVSRITFHVSARKVTETPSN
jgi:hypothetical protein